MSLENIPQLKKALEFTEIALTGKKRKSGELVVNHCIRVAEILVQYHVLDHSTLMVALLHHSVSDGAATLEDVKKEFDEDIYLMLEAFDNLKIIRARPGMADEFAENLRKMFLVLAKDLRVVLIKLADILDNLSTLEHLAPDKKEEVARETLEIFAPLAERLGMGEMKGEMQDQAFYHLELDEYLKVKKLANNRLQKLTKALVRVKPELSQAFLHEGINAQFQSRFKHLYSLYIKLNRSEIAGDINKIYDLLAMRVIVATSEECYKVLGIINKIVTPAEGKISDFIAHPKPNGYQSIHVKVLGPSNLPFEIQIRTVGMHEEAEYGVAAHWHYAEQKEVSVSDKKISQGFVASNKKLEWVKRLSEWQKEIVDNQEFLKTVKTDFFGTRIYVFTPKGDVIDLPKGATSIDFAYKVHTDLGHRVTGAKVSGKVVSLDTKLKNSDIVELTLSKDPKKKPNRDWLNFVITSLAKRKIKRACYE